VAEHEDPASFDHRWFARYQARASEKAERTGGAAHRRRMLAGLAGDVLEVGAGSGINFRHYPPAVRQVVAVEPEPHLRETAARAARVAPIPVDVVHGVAEDLPVPDASMDAVVVAGVLCSVPDPTATLAEFARVIRTGGELRFYEHVVSDHPVLAGLQRTIDALVWPRLFAGCQTARDTASSIRSAGFEFQWIERLSFRPTLVSILVAPRILGSARRS
jgi:ubiquinone/menaquinone biosynthesis C-methylase UbiE